MSITAIVPELLVPPASRSARSQPRLNPRPYVPLSVPYPAHTLPDSANRQAELFYLQKQVHAQTQMVVVLEDGERVEGRIEWYDRNTIKVAGRHRTLVYKAAIKYMYKQNDLGRQGAGISN